MARLKMNEAASGSSNVEESAWESQRNSSDSPSSVGDEISLSGTDGRSTEAMSGTNHPDL